MRFPEKLTYRIQKRLDDHTLRELSPASSLIDFASNDYLGFSRSQEISQAAHLLLDCNPQNGSTGSRLLSGNQPLHSKAEELIATFHKAESSLLYNSGYDANLGFFSCVPQRGDIILYDELCHASIRDGLRLSNVNAYKFSHNDLENLTELVEKHSAAEGEIYIATESVFSMDGDSPELHRLCEIAANNNCLLIIDEAHALGVFGKNGSGLVQELQLQDQIFARIVTFGKGLGCHGAAVLGSQQLIQYLINYSRSFIYTTAIAPHSAATIISAYEQLAKSANEIEMLRENILHFNREITQLGIKQLFVKGKSAIQSAIIPGNETVKKVAAELQRSGYDVRPILSPTVPAGQERLRFCLHSFNSQAEISDVLRLLATFVYG
ncbi:MAG TPA: pyridoxal phosphate-dependent aminotransferase family protein [Flavobacterium sp.]